MGINLELEVPETDANQHRRFVYGSYNKAFKSCAGQPILIRELRDYHNARQIDISHNPPQVRMWMRQTAMRCARVANWTGNGLVVMAAYRHTLKNLEKLR